MAKNIQIPEEDFKKLLKFYAMLPPELYVEEITEIFETKAKKIKAQEDYRKNLQV